MKTPASSNRAERVSVATSSASTLSGRPALAEILRQRQWRVKRCSLYGSLLLAQIESVLDMAAEKSRERERPASSVASAVMRRGGLFARFGFPKQIRGRGVMAAQEPSKLLVRVRSPSPASSSEPLCG